MVYTARHNLFEPERYVFGHHPSYKSLMRSLEQGCVLCKQFDSSSDLEEDVNPTFEAFGYYSVLTFSVESSSGSPPMMIVYWGEDTEYMFHELTKFEGKFTTIATNL